MTTTTTTMNTTTMTTITFTRKQLEALKSVLTLFDEQEYDYVREHYELPDEDTIGSGNILTMLKKIGAGDTTWADMQRVWGAINGVPEGEVVEEDSEDEEEEEQLCGVCGKSCKTDETDDLVLVAEFNGVKHCFPVKRKVCKE